MIRQKHRTNKCNSLVYGCKYSVEYYLTGKNQNENRIYEIDVSNKNILPHSMIYRVAVELPVTLGLADLVKRCSYVCLVYHCSLHDSNRKEKSDDINKCSVGGSLSAKIDYEFR